MAMVLAMVACAAAAPVQSQRARRIDLSVRGADLRDVLRLLAETEGVFAETAGGVTLGAALKLIAGGQIGKDDGPVVICITGNGMKTQDPLVGKLPTPALIGPRLGDFDELQATWT